MKWLRNWRERDFLLARSFHSRLGMARGLGLFLALLLAGTSASGEVRHPLSFDSWKAKKVARAKSDYSRIKARLAWVKRPLSVSQDRALRHAKLNLEIARSLSANEYFIVYLTEKFPKDSNALKVVTRKMSTRNITEILVEYQRLILQGATPRYEFMHSYHGLERQSPIQPAIKSR